MLHQYTVLIFHILIYLSAVYNNILTHTYKCIVLPSTEEGLRSLA
jgi:hypothetical protein